jgi:long-chain fatty acid transport protein
VPQQVGVSAYHQLNDRLAIMGNVVWQDWSEFGEPGSQLANTNVSNETVNLNYDDTWGFALGAQYAFADGWLWSVGGGYDSSPVGKMSARRRCPWMSSSASAPASVQLQRQHAVGAAHEYMNGGDNNIDVERGPLAGRLEGDYKSFDSLRGPELDWRFRSGLAL